jgi:AbrB family looped-hinge helix DNA binding protein
VQQVKISPKFQVVIPKVVRESMHLQPGQRLQVIEYGDRIELVPIRDVQSMRGFLSGMNTDLQREPDREF